MRRQFLNAAGSGVLFAVAVLGGIGIGSRPGNAADEDESKIQQGFAIAPVPLNLTGTRPGVSRTGQLHRECAGRLQWLPHQRSA